MQDATLLLIADQGFGDVIQFCRYIPWAAQQCPRIAVACSKEMSPILRQLHPGLHLIEARVLAAGEDDLANRPTIGPLFSHSRATLFPDTSGARYCVDCAPKVWSCSGASIPARRTDPCMPVLSETTIVSPSVMPTTVAENRLGSSGLMTPGSLRPFIATEVLDGNISRWTIQPPKTAPITR